MRQASRNSSLTVPLIALYLYAAGSAPFLGQWDSFDYLKLIVMRQLSPLGFGRPVYIGGNILLWETLQRLFHLEVTKIEYVVMAGTIVFGVVGIIIFRRLTMLLLPADASRMAVLALAISPLYVIYSGFIMTEVPMLTLLMAAALVLWKTEEHHASSRDILGGILFGLAVGVREQALMVSAAYLWIIYCRRRQWLASAIRFGAASAVFAVAPVLGFYLADPAAFAQRTKFWLSAIPMEQIHFWNNVESSLLHIITICPAAWIAAACAVLWFFIRKKNERTPIETAPRIPHPAWGVICCIAMPIVALWRDADVQMHPRYALIALPGSIVLCVSLFHRFFPGRRGLIAWASLNVAFLGVGLATCYQTRQIETERMQYVESIRDQIKGEALFIAGSYSPMLDYYRGIGVRPEWRILWTGWGWDLDKADAAIRDAWMKDIPVYMIEEPLGWRYLEAEFLHFYFFSQDHRKQPVLLNKLYRIYP